MIILSLILNAVCLILLSLLFVQLKQLEYNLDSYQHGMRCRVDGVEESFVGLPRYKAFVDLTEYRIGSLFEGQHELHYKLHQEIDKLKPKKKPKKSTKAEADKKKAKKKTTKKKVTKKKTSKKGSKK